MNEETENEINYFLFSFVYKSSCFDLSRTY